MKGIFPEKLEQFFNEIDEPKNDYENVVKIALTVLTIEII